MFGCKASRRQTHVSHCPDLVDRADDVYSLKAIAQARVRVYGKVWGYDWLFARGSFGKGARKMKPAIKSGSR